MQNILSVMTGAQMYQSVLILMPKNVKPFNVRTIPRSWNESEREKEKERASLRIWWNEQKLYVAFSLVHEGDLKDIQQR